MAPVLGPVASKALFSKITGGFSGIIPARENVRKNLEFAGLPRRFEKEILKNFGAYLGEFLSLRNHPENLDRILGDCDFGAIEKLRQQGRSCLAATCHYGNWEVGALSYGKYFPDVSVIIRTTGDAYLDGHIRACRGSNNLIDIDNGGRQVLKVLGRAKSIVCAAVDEPRDEGVEVQFLGRTVFFPQGLFRMAKKSGVAIVPTLCKRNKGLINVIAQEPVADAQELADCFSQWIRDDPSQWMLLSSYS